MATGDKKKAVMQSDIDASTLSNDQTRVPSSSAVKSALSVIGNLADSSDTKSVTSGTWVVLCSKTLDPGTYILVASVGFGYQSAGVRFLVVETNDGTDPSLTVGNGIIGSARCNLTKTMVITNLTQTTYYLKCQQTSGETMGSVSGLIQVVRLN